MPKYRRLRGFVAPAELGAEKHVAFAVATGPGPEVATELLGGGGVIKFTESDQ